VPPLYPEPSGAPAYPGSAPYAGAPSSQGATPYGGTTPGTGPEGAPYGGSPYAGTEHATPAGHPGAGQGYPPPYGATPYGPTPYGAGPYGATPYGQQAPQPTDGVSIAALVTGILTLGPLPLILGIVGLRRTRRDGTRGRGMAIAGVVLGVLSTLAWTGIAILIAMGLGALSNAVQERIDDLHTSCAAGDMADCDTLASIAPAGSAEEEFGETCGGRTDGSTLCTMLEQPDTGADSSDDGAVGGAYGSDPTLDALWDACDAGDFQACDDLYDSSPFGSDYESFGATCGNRIQTDQYCTEAMAG